MHIHPPEQRQLVSSVYCPKVVGTSNLFNMSSGWGADTRFRKTDIEQFPGGQKHSQTPDGQYWKHLQVSYIVKDQTSFENARNVPCQTKTSLSQFPVTIQEFGPISQIDIRSDQQLTFFPV